MSKKDQLIIQECNRLKNILSNFNLELHGFDPGVSAVYKNKEIFIYFDRKEWNFIEPLLIELIELRKKYNEN